ncbi:MULTISPECIES: DUF732 domain-containing protein [unclassified Microbacterium]|uniref:DUF732 domain-containing protein n=1 Tax=unclassified Microbacterium TaxID=2609290 RepID=UPI00301AEA5B
MPKVTGGVVAAIVVLFALTGCAGVTTGTAGVGTEKAGPASTDAPLTAEAPAEAPTGEAAFLEHVRANLPANTQIPSATDPQLLAAGERACEEIAAGADTLTLSLIEGEKPDDSGFYPDSAAIIVAARASLCS